MPGKSIYTNFQRMRARVGGREANQELPEGGGGAGTGRGGDGPPTPAAHARRSWCARPR